MTSRKAVKICWKVFAWLLVIGGSVYQLYNITELYRRYDTVNDVTVTRNYPSAPPTIVVCSSPGAFLEPSTKFDIRDFDTIQPSELLNASLHPELAAESFMYRKLGFQMGFSDGGVANDMRMEIFFKNQRICYLFEVKSEVGIDKNQLHTALFGYLKIGLEKTFIRGGYLWYLYMIPAETKSYDVIDSLLELQPIQKPYANLTTLLSFDYVKSISKPYPYQTNCLDYKQQNFDSRAHAYAQCIRERFLDDSGAVPAFIPISQTDDIWVMHEIAMLFPNESITEIQRYCMAITSRSDCHQELYIPRLLRTSTIGRYLSVQAPGTPQIVTSAKAKIDLIDFVTYVLSCLSFWFAFSPLVFLTDGKAYRAVCDRLKRRGNKNQESA